MSGVRVGPEILRERRSTDTDDENDDTSDESDSHAAPIMSIFASYYGMEDSSAQEMKGTIDDANFNSDHYVKDLLTNESMEGLVIKDAEMVQDIRNLDGEMQKLVYDNYNKFITATETIKEMKNDVYGMDPDMDTVRTKMKQIASTSSKLDEAMEENRNQVDKLVRVRRLLERLEFLSELPEKLATLIEKEHYREAVQLYKKSITVLTNHSHVLSFKKIQERTETMMTAMTERVIALLNDPSLTAVKLTQHVSVLRLMNAPRLKVSTTLLSAHRNRALVLINSFKQTLQQSNELQKSHTAESAEDTEQNIKALKIIGSSREFHQITMVGLLESIKGILELYNTAPQEMPQSPAHTHSEQAAMATPQECRGAYDQLVSTLTAIMDSYMDTMLVALNAFFTRFHALVCSPSAMSLLLEFTLEAGEDVLGLDRDKFNADMEYLHQLFSKIASKAGDRSVESGSDVNVFALQEERSSWLLLMRQAVMDVSYLDSTLRDCREQLCGDNHSESVQFTTVFAKKIIHQLTEHTDTMRKHLVASYVQHISNEWLPKINLLLQVAKNAEEPTVLPSVAGYALSSAREITQLHVTFMQSVHEVLLDRCIHTFTESCRYIKSVVDILEVLDTEGTMLQSTLIDELNIARLPDQLLGAFLEELTLSMQGAISLTDNYRNRYSLTSFDGQPLPTEEQDDVFLHQWYAVSRGKESEAADIEFIEAPLALIFTALLRRLSAFTAIQRLSEELNGHDLFPSYRPSESYRQRCSIHCQAVSRQFVDYFLSENSKILVDGFLSALQDCYENGYIAVTHSSALGKESSMKAITAIILSQNTLSVAQRLDTISAFVYLVFAESIPTLKVVPDMARRSSLAMGGRQLVGGGITSNQSHMSLQMDIERLFSQKIAVYPPLHRFNNLYSKGNEREIVLNSELVIGTLLKSILKAGQDSIRTMTLPSQSYLVIQADATFMKQVALTLLRDVTETDQLVDGILSSVFSRYQGANDIENASDGNEMKIIAKAITEGFAGLADVAILVTKPLGGR